MELLEAIGVDPLYAFVAGAASLVALALYFFEKWWAIVRWLWFWGRPEAQSAPPPVVLKLETPPQPVLERPVDTVVLTIETYEAQVRTRIAEAQAHWEKAEGAEKEQLGHQIGELKGRLENIEPAFEAAKARIAELEQLLEREGNHLGAGRLDRAEKALAAGDFDEADALLAEISAKEDLAVQRKARAEFGRGQIAEEQVRWNDAARHYGEAARLNPTYDTLERAGTFYWRAGDYAQKARVEEDLVALSKREYGEQSEMTAGAINNLALAYQVLGRYDEAEPLHQEAIEIGKATIGEGHPNYAIRLNNLALLLRDMGRYEEAEPLIRQAIDIDKATIGEAHPDYAILLNNLANLLRAMGRYDEAEPLYRQAIEIDKATVGEAHPEYAIRLNNLAMLLQDMGKPQEARPLFAAQLDIKLTALGDDHPSTKLGAANSAKLLRQHFPDDPALEELEATFGPDIGKE